MIKTEREILERLLEKVTNIKKEQIAITSLLNELSNDLSEFQSLFPIQPKSESTKLFIFALAIPVLSYSFP